MPGDREIIGKYVPEAALDLVYDTLIQHKFRLHISRKRATKLGDFRAGTKGSPHRISLNHDLNPYHFLVVFVHEYAHLVVYEQYGRRTQPHGIEWKTAYRKLMQPYFDRDVFPPDLRQALENYLVNAKAINGSDVSLARALANYDLKQSAGTDLEQLAEGTQFRTAAGRVFKKLDKQRKRYKCLCMATGRLYLFNPLAKVHPLSATD